MGKREEIIAHNLMGVVVLLRNIFPLIMKIILFTTSAIVVEITSR